MLKSLKKQTNYASSNCCWFFFEVIGHASALDGLFLMISEVRPKIRLRILEDLLEMLRRNEKNRVTST